MNIETFDTLHERMDMMFKDKLFPPSIYKHGN